MLEVGVSSRNLPSLDFHMRDADCVGAPPAADCVFVEQSEQEGGVDGGVENEPTAATSVARAVIVLASPFTPKAIDAQDLGTLTCLPRLISWFV